MNKIVIVLFLVFTVASAQSGNCLTDIIQLVPSFENLAQAVEAGNLSLAITDLETIAPEIEQTIQACAQQYSITLPSFVVNANLPQCIQDIGSIVTNAEVIAQDPEDIAEDINEIEAIITTFQSLLGDCGIQSMMNPGDSEESTMSTVFIADSAFGCLNGIIQLVPSLENLAFAGNLFSDLETIAPEIQNTLEACAQQYGITLPSFIVNANPDQCIQDIQSIITDAESVDENPGDIFEDFSAITGIISTFQSLMSDCGIQSMMSGGDSEEGSTDKTPNFNCLNDIIQLVPGLENLAVEAGNFSLAIADLETIAPEIQQTIEACAQQYGITLPSFVVNANPDQCIQDITSIVNDTEEIVQNPAGIFEDISEIKEILTLLQSLLSDCGFEGGDSEEGSGNQVPVEEHPEDMTESKEQEESSKSAESESLEEKSEEFEMELSEEELEEIVSEDPFEEETLQEEQASEFELEEESLGDSEMNPFFTFLPGMARKIAA